MKKKILEVEHLQKIYESHGYGVPVLKDINLTIDQGDFVAIMGPSGSGKSTLLNLISSIDQPTKGVIKLAGQDIVHMNAKALSKLRKDTIGFVFQDYSLLDSMSLLDNIVLPLSLNGAKAAISLIKGKRLARHFSLSAH
uniref:ABC transporter ATP-binding protein n=1 Tax=Dubosiella newyorkensis TaxID=1862672 RepID=UPI00259C908C